MRSGRSALGGSRNLRESRTISCVRCKRESALSCGVSAASTCVAPAAGGAEVTIPLLWIYACEENTPTPAMMTPIDNQLVLSWHVSVAYLCRAAKLGLGTDPEPGAKSGTVKAKKKVATRSGPAPGIAGLVPNVLARLSSRLVSRVYSRVCCQAFIVACVYIRAKRIMQAYTAALFVES